jgi:type VI secretion system protein ImpF
VNRPEDAGRNGRVAPIKDRDRLQPALLDRLIDSAPGESAESEASRVISRTQLREAVLRDLTWLLNSVQPPAIDPAVYPEAASSVLNFGLPPLSGTQISTLEVATLEHNIRRAVLSFEPRILGESLRVRALDSESILDAHNQIFIELSGLLWSQPIPLEFLIRTRLDLESGQVTLGD